MQEKTLLDFFVAVAPYFNELIMGDCAVYVCDKEKTLAYVPGKTLDHKVKVGDPVKDASVAGTAMRTGKRVIKRVGKELYGIPYIGIGIPVRNTKGEIIGAVSLNENTSRQDDLLAMADTLSGAIHEISSITEELAAQSQELSAISTDLKNIGGEMASRVKKTDSVLKLMKKITSQTNLLGLNAAIEAARSGQSGLGFGVVAGEIRKLSDSSANSLKEIENTVAALNDSNTKLVSQIEVIAGISAEQSKAIGQVAASAANLYEMAKKLLSYANSLAN